MVVGGLWSWGYGPGTFDRAGAVEATTVERERASQAPLRRTSARAIAGPRRVAGTAVDADTLAWGWSFWNDFEILQLIDACDKGERGGIHNGIALAETLAANRGVSLTEQDYASLIRELLVLHSGGLLTWQVMSSLGRVRPITPNEPNDYLNNIRDFALTIDGRDRSRGQIVQVPTPDPAEDDGRMIATLTLEDVARSIDRVHAPFQAIQLLIEAGISPEQDSGDEGETWEKVLPIFVLLSLGTSGQRRELRNFLGAWLDDELHTGPSGDEREKIEHALARQGWFVKDGRLVVGERVRRVHDAGPPMLAPDRLHPSIWAAAEPQWATRHLHDAVMAASKAVNAMLQGKVGRDDIAEVALVREAFSPNPPVPGRPRLRFAAIENERTRESVTQGALSFGVGCFQAIRNPVGHLPDDEHDLSEQEALEQLAAWSLFARWIERATLTPGGD